MALAILTSGGDAPGMNPAIRAVALAAHRTGDQVLAVREGYDGLIHGWIEPLGPADVESLLGRGGTVLGTARSTAFREPEGRRKATLALASRGIDRVVVIGGDGSLTGANILVQEWSTHLAALVQAGELTDEAAGRVPALRVVGLIGSIDNDFWGTDTTIGGDSALHRVVDAIDALTSTASSHQRTFVVEVMGRHCGWLALSAALCTQADAVLVPEAPPPDWRASVVEAVRRSRAAGRRHAVVIVAEGARDPAGQPIPSSAVRDALRDALDVDVRVTVLGHVQRGGVPSAYDRVMTTVLGDRAVSALARADAPLVLGTAGPAVVQHPLPHAVAQSRRATRAVIEGRADEALELRGPRFAELLDLVRALEPQPVDASEDLHSSGSAAPAILVAHVGAPAPGMNAAVASVVHHAHAAGWRTLGAHEGLRGLARGDLQPLQPADVEGFVARGGAELGTNRDVPPIEELLPALSAHDIRGIVLIGGFETLEVARALSATQRAVAVVPATISSNVPATWRSVGSDTACNAILEAVDRLRQSAIGARNRVFVVEVMGRRCGALAATAAVGAGADRVLTHEDGVDLHAVRTACDALNRAFDHGREVGLALIADGVAPPYDARSLTRILAAESDGRFDTRLCVLGHLQQGGRPSPADRIDGLRLGAAATRAVIEGTEAVVIGLDRDGILATPLAQALGQADSVSRRPQRPAHADLLALARELAG